MEVLSSSQRQYLKSLAHHRKSVVQVGKNGLTDQMIKEVDRALDAHELIKVKFIDFQDRKQELSLELAERSGSERVGLVGNIAILYRKHSDGEKRKIRLPA